MLGVIKGKADAGCLTGKRDYSLPLFYLTTGSWRGDVLSLRRRGVEIEGEAMIVSVWVEGGGYQSREVDDPSAPEARLHYLRASRRPCLLRDDGSLWAQHDLAGEPGAALSTHSFGQNLNRYAREGEADVGEIHLHGLLENF